MAYWHSSNTGPTWFLILFPRFLKVLKNGILLTKYLKTLLWISDFFTHNVTSHISDETIQKYVFYFNYESLKPPWENSERGEQILLGKQKLFLARFSKKF